MKKSTTLPTHRFAVGLALGVAALSTPSLHAHLNPDLDNNSPGGSTLALDYVNDPIGGVSFSITATIPNAGATKCFARL
jgi:hypothetical protein